MSDAIDILGQLWRSQVGVGRRQPDVARPMAVVEYLVSGPRHSNLVKVENLSFLILYDEASRGMFPTIHFAAYRGARVPWGAKWGGAHHCWVFKDLAVPPRDDGRGAQFDSRRPFLLETALRLDRYPRQSACAPVNGPRKSFGSIGATTTGPSCCPWTG